jgi:hypothetical protein
LGGRRPKLLPDFSIQTCAGPTARDGETPSITRSPRAERQRRRQWRHDAAGTEAPGAVGDAPQLPRYARRARHTAPGCDKMQKFTGSRKKQKLLERISTGNFPGSFSEIEQEKKNQTPKQPIFINQSESSALVKIKSSYDI